MLQRHFYFVYSLDVVAVFVAGGRRRHSFTYIVNTAGENLPVQCFNSRSLGGLS